MKSARAQQTGPGLRFVIRTGSGHDLAVDDGTGNSGPRPAELLLAAQAGCTAFDVASILAVSAMLSAGPAEVHHRYLIHRGEGSDVAGGVVVTGPGADPDALATTRGAGAAAPVERGAA